MTVHTNSHLVRPFESYRNGFIFIIVFILLGEVKFPHILDYDLHVATNTTPLVVVKTFTPANHVARLAMYTTVVVRLGFISFDVKVTRLSNHTDK